MKRAAPCWTRPGNAKNWEIDSKHRLWKQGFRPHDESTMGVTPEIQEQMIKRMLTEEDQLEDVTIEQWFSPAFFQSQLWYDWSSVLPFQPYHSLIEMRRYAVRFMHQLHLIRSLWGILRTKYDQYSSLIRPLEKYLADHGVRFVSGAAVTDMDIRIEGTDKTVTALHIGEGAGEEIMREFLYDCGLEDTIGEIMPLITAIPVGMPFTSQFMPRKLKDRPEVIPAGNKNLAFIGQFVELEGDVVFTVETSVRTAMIAVYRMLHLDRPITPLFQGQYDIRMVNVALKTLLGKDKIELSDLPKINPLKLPQTMHEIVNAINQIPLVPEYYSERTGNQ